MPQIFSRGVDTVARASLVGAPVLGAVVLWACLVYTRSSYGTGAALERVQTVPFSHEHHAGALGIDCRYCHTHVEHAAYAGLPATKICMNCHAQMWVGSAMLEPVRESYRTGRSLTWQRVYNLPGFVYFDHSVHVHKGVGCSSCHGRVDRMPLMNQAPSLLMEWCLDCHRHPEQHLRPREAVFDMHWRAPPDQAEQGQALATKYRIRDATYLTSCSVCHR
jgi:hypothetical protein